MPLFTGVSAPFATFKCACCKALHSRWKRRSCCSQECHPMCTAVARNLSHAFAIVMKAIHWTIGMETSSEIVRRSSPASNAERYLNVDENMHHSQSLWLVMKTWSCLLSKRYDSLEQASCLMADQLTQQQGVTAMTALGCRLLTTRPQAMASEPQHFAQVWSTEDRVSLTVSKRLLLQTSGEAFYLCCFTTS